MIVRAKRIGGAVSWRSKFNKERIEKSRKMNRTSARKVRMQQVSKAAPLPSARTIFLQNFAVNKT